MTGTLRFSLRESLALAADSLRAAAPVTAALAFGLAAEDPLRLAELAVVACRAAGLTVADGYPNAVSPIATAHDLADALADAAVDPRVDALVVVFAPPVPGQHADEDADFAAALASVALAGEKPAVGTMVFGRVPPRVPVYASVEEAVRALARVVNYADWLRRPPGVLPTLSDVDFASASSAASTRARCTSASRRTKSARSPSAASGTNC